MLSRLLRLGLLVPEDFRMDLGFSHWDPGLGSEGEAGGKPLCNVLLCVWRCMGASRILLCFYSQMREK